MTRRSLPAVLLAETAQRAMVELAGRALPVETGGIMVGVLSEGRPWITAVEEIKQPESSRTQFRIPSGVTHTIVDRFRQTDPATGYLGDWHTHPRDVPASPLDRLTLASLVLGLGHKQRLIAVVRLAPKGWTVDVWRQGRLRSERCAVVLTGAKE